MMKYGVVGAIALAVLVAALWDGSKKKTGETAKAEPRTESASTDASVAGEVGGHSAVPAPPPVAPPAPPPVIEPPKVVEDVLEKYQVKPHDTIKKIAKIWLGDESLAKDLYEFNKARIPDPKKLSSQLTLVFPRSRFPKKDESKGEPRKSDEGAVSSGTAGALAGSLKKEEVKPTDVPASSEKKYVVKEGDTLYAIAAHELGKGIRWKEIADLNNVTPESLKKGQTIVLPSK